MFHMIATCLVAEYQSSDEIQLPDKVQIALEVLLKFDFHADAVSVAWNGPASALETLDQTLFTRLPMEYTEEETNPVLSELTIRSNSWGYHENAVEYISECLRNGSIVIIVTSTPPRLDEAERALKTTDADTLQRFDTYT